jgi:signal transduction histidine kinase
LEAEAANKGVVWQGQGEIWVRGSLELLRSAIENVLRNAVRFTKPGTQVTATLQTANGRVVVTVRDQGPGVPHAELERIFEPFYRVPDAEHGGSGGGLGLTISARAVNLHGGTVRARNASGGGDSARGGLIVEISLPLASKPALAA